MSESDLVGLLPSQLAHKVAPRLKLEIYALAMAVNGAVICMIWHKRNTGHAAHRWLREQAMEILSALNEKAA